MKELNAIEINEVSGGGLSIGGDLNGALRGLFEGAVVGAIIGGKFAGAGGFGFGALAQLVGVVGSRTFGAVWGAGYGLIYGEKAVIDATRYFLEKAGGGSRNS
ncbi:hypothetical protein [Acinetobacter bereziniae]|jgi:hypothetical protein|uniref:DUF5862 family protein n=1 Tax=Acinetobacter bereziniae TaxID=106648 RepID=UPI0021CFB1DC|nr:hypothetical protein [Acinetobacter bereziniae]MCU4315049.1 hypothetical protein [Acinetobacter bereziniae]